MALINRYIVQWSVPNAGPAVSVLHFGQSGPSAMESAVDAVRDFYVAAAAYLPNDVSVSFPATFDTIDDTTGSLVGSGIITAGATVTGLSSGGWAAGAGFRVAWETGFVRNGRRVRGSTFFVPAAATSFTTVGQVSSTVRTAMDAAADSLLFLLEGAGAPLVVWSRPTSDVVGGSTPVASGSVPALAATLRERKY